MSTQSPATAAFRALVMLACLILVPLAALFGTSLPGPIREFFNGTGKWGPRAGSSQASFPVAPVFNPVYSSTAGAAATGSPPSGAAWPGPSGAPCCAPTGAQQGLPVASAPAPAWGNASAAPPYAATSVGTTSAGQSNTLLASYEAHAELTQNPQSSPWQNGPIGTAAPPFLSDSLSPAGSNVALASQAGPSIAAPPPSVDRFTYIERRLRELGSVYSLLETQGENYRFHCRMAIAGSANYTRYFEASDPDPLQAMSRVLAEIEAWRSAP